MFVPTGFNSYKDYFNFVWAREFFERESNQVFTYPKSTLEVVGGWLAKPTLSFADHTLKNIKKPVMITALTLAAIASVTILFYPEQFVEHLGKAVPLVLSIKPWMVKAGLYTLTQSLILGIGLRTLGRLNNAQLWNAWTAAPRRIVPISIGTELVLN